MEWWALLSALRPFSLKGRGNHPVSKKWDFKTGKEVGTRRHMDTLLHQPAIGPRADWVSMFA